MEFLGKNSSAGMGSAESSTTWWIGSFGVQGTGAT